MLVERVTVSLIRNAFTSSIIACLSGFKEPDASLHGPALEQLRVQIRTSTSSMTSVPKPLKFLREHYETLKTAHSGWPDGENRVGLGVGCVLCDGSVRSGV
jgi:hypothetical protein